MSLHSKLPNLAALAVGLLVLAATPRAVVVPGKAPREPVRVDGAVTPELGHDGEGLLRVIRVGPGRRWQRARGEELLLLLFREEELLAEGVAHGEAEQGECRAFASEVHRGTDSTVASG